jgi:hypothetical protein
MPLSFYLIGKDKKILELDDGGATSGNTGYLTSVEYEHHKIHEGDHYECSDYDSDVDITGPKYWHIKTPASGRTHLTFEVIAARNGLLEFFENPTITGDGTLLTCYNNDRNSSNTPNTLFYYDATASSDGTKLDTFVIGSDGSNPVGDRGGDNRRNNEWILKASESYLIKFTAATDNCRVSMQSEFYEVS